MAPLPSSPPPIIIRPASLLEYPQVARLCGDAYYNGPLTCLMAPQRAKYYSHYTRGFRHRALKRMLDPANVTMVACEAGAPETAVGYIQMVRYGNDAGRPAFIVPRAVR